MLEGKSILMIIARQNFRDEELAEPRAVLQQAGARVTIASSAIELSVGMLGKVKVKADTTIDKVDARAYDAVVFVGGSGASEYFDDATAHRIAREAHEAGKVVAAICIAPATLANAGLLKSKKATAYPSVKGNLIRGGAKFTGAGVERDGLIITADGPLNARKFGETIRDALAGK
jgi:protease I